MFDKGMPNKAGKRTGWRLAGTAAAAAGVAVPLLALSAPAALADGGSASGDGAAPACLTSQLEVTDNGSTAGAGSRYIELRIANTSDDPCTIQGHFDEVRWLRGDGEPLGDPAATTAEAGEPIVIGQGVDAYATVRVPSPGAFDPEECLPEKASLLHLVPPSNQATYDVAFDDVTVCSASGAGTSQISAFRPDSRV
ncbi:DUF4232 domain-containing protein [Nocardiopsis composta]|uniref:DUF4232 domain-containing protein n=1 Tax=Nocardiopsis composta TaxID=157465 RepID=A0A7W8QLM1_9ACTN|nr:DUF4232 domain-containing protein [Nocardiopsis composta]MBB5432529.1 hypothetical protein [Nocardiopsis composta]